MTHTPPETSIDFTKAAAKPGPLAERMSRVNINGRPKAEQTMMLLTNLISAVDELLVEQNTKISRLAELMADKASVQQFDNIIANIDRVLEDVRVRMGHLPTDTPEAEPVPRTFMDMWRDGDLVIDTSLEYNPNACMMAIMGSNNISLLDIRHDAHGQPSYAPVNPEENDRQLFETVRAAITENGYTLGDVVHVGLNIITQEPLNEQSVKMAPVETQSKETI